MKAVVFENLAHKQFLEWEKRDKKNFIKIVELIADCRTTDN